jgi:RNA polymerase sigma-70 factor (ECF subfamily)
LEKHSFQRARPELGRFRSFLLAAMKHFLLNDVQHRRALKRGGGQALQSLDAETAEGKYLRELADEKTPEAIFDRAWACAVLDRVLARLRSEWRSRGKAGEFDRLKACLSGDSRETSYRELGGELGLSEGAVKVTVHRLRRRFQQVLREEVAETVVAQDAIDEEIRQLFWAVSEP